MNHLLTAQLEILEIFDANIDRSRESDPFRGREGLCFGVGEKHPGVILVFRDITARKNAPQS